MSTRFILLAPFILPILTIACADPKPVDSGDPAPACEESDTPFVRVQLPADVPAADDDVSWEAAGESRVCVDEGEGAWRCDAPAGAVEIRVHVAGHEPVTADVQVPAEGCMPTIEPALESLGDPFSEDRAYYIQWFPDEDECARSIELYGVNCYSYVVFCADGDAEAMLTDIVYPGIYAVDRGLITTHFDGSGEMSEDIGFAIVSDQAVVDSDFGYTWVLDTQDRFVPYSCREGGG